MADSIQTTWNKFERWQARYKKTCYKAIDEMIEYDYDPLEKDLFLQNGYEYDLDLILDTGLSQSDLQRRVTNKIIFFVATWLIFLMTVRSLWLNTPIFYHYNTLANVTTLIVFG